jgi:hypothetical protein
MCPCLGVSWKVRRARFRSKAVQGRVYEEGGSREAARAKGQTSDLSMERGQAQSAKKVRQG